jgi:hypothetical protein
MGYMAVRLQLRGFGRVVVLFLDGMGRGFLVNLRGLSDGFGRGLVQGFMSRTRGCIPGLKAAGQDLDQV